MGSYSLVCFRSQSIKPILKHFTSNEETYKELLIILRIIYFELLLTLNLKEDILQDLLNFGFKYHFQNMIYICTYTYICMYICICTYIIFKQIRNVLNTYMHVYVHTHIFICHICFLKLYTCIYRYI